MGYESDEADFSTLNDHIDQILDDTPGICLLLDRYDALGLTGEDSKGNVQLAGSLRALRDLHKYDLTYVTASRRLPNPQDELAELFYAHTFWLGPLNESDSRLTVQRYANRKELSW